ncbi:MAG: carboxymuconolactone decarboxylase family protein [bacterium]
MSWLGSDSFAGVFALRPQLFADYQAFADRLWTDRAVDPRVLELCRLRVAQILGCTSELRRRSPGSEAAGVDESRLAELADWPRSAHFSAAERACLRFAEGFALDPHGLSDDDAAAVAAHLTPAEMVALVEALALFDGFTRFRLMLGVEG